MTTNRHFLQRGAVNGQLIINICLLVVIVALSGLSAWLYGQYTEQKTDVDGKISVAEAEARKDQSEIEETKFAEREKEPRREFAGPEDYGRLTFSYPKTWSVYIDQDASTRGNRFAAYMNPIIVPPVGSNSARYALRVVIENVAYDRKLDSYRQSITRGDLTSRPITVNEHVGTRLDGNIERDVRGSAVIFRVRDKTITILTEADTFREDFEAVIQTIDFNA